jgi:5'(3')-deoxyribonucleotidase
MKPRILVDCDGVMAAFVNATLERVRLMTGKAFTPDQVTAWDVIECLGVPEATCKEIYTSMEQKWFCENIEPFPGAHEGVQELRNLGDVYCVTAPFRGDYWMAEREKWLKKHFDFPRSKIVFCHDKHIIAGDVLIDDKTETCIKWQEANTQGTAILFERSYNKRDDWGGFRVPNWDSLISVVRDIL